MIKITQTTMCSGCSSCAQICPKNCITMMPDTEGFSYPKIDESKCVNCGLCEKACPILSKNELNQYNTVAYAAVNNDEKIRLLSSSGGVFTAIASSIVSRGGVVFGAAFDADFNVVHRCVDRVKDIQLLRGSKYVQSKIGDTYRQAKEYLQNGRIVYFSGTPCQVAGLYKYLGRVYDNLITQDVVCHGVPSPLVWQKYLSSRKNFSIENLISVSFRDKRHSWEKYQISIESDGDRIETEHSQDPYMKAFLYNLCLRPSCYDCAFKGVERKSDLTLADYWGIQNIHPELDDDKGVSLVLVNSSKGREMLESVIETIFIKPTDLGTAIKYNSAAVVSVKLPKTREKFMRDIQKQSFDRVVNRYAKDTLICQMRRFLAKIYHKVRGK